MKKARYLNFSIVAPEHYPTRPRMFTINDSFFKTWSEEMSYCLGFIAADGCLYKRQLIIRINKIDKEHLENMLGVMDYMSQGKTIIESKDNTVAIYLTSPEMVEDLINLGIGFRKSLTLNWLDIPDAYKRHFIRGYFDGDGSIHIPSDPSKIGKRKINFTGTKMFLDGMKAELTKELGTAGSVYPKKDSKIFRADFWTNQGYLILEYMYNDSNISLHRKSLQRNNYPQPQMLTMKKAA